MSRANKGDRVGVMLGAKADIIEFIGYGTYLGEEIPPPEIGGYNFQALTPKIQLDDGKIVWGCEIWWGDETAMKRNINAWEVEGFTIQTIDIDEARAAAKQREPAE